MKGIVAAALLLALSASARAGSLGVPHFGGDVRNSGVNDPNLTIQPGVVGAQPFTATGNSATSSDSAADRFGHMGFDPKSDGHAKGDAVVYPYGGMVAAGSRAFCAQQPVFSSGDVGKVIMIAGAHVGVGFGVFQASIAFHVSPSCVTLSAAAITATDNVALLQSAAEASPGTGYVPGEVVTAAGGTFSTAAQIPVATTQVVSATLAAGGSGGTNGACTLRTYGGNPAVGSSNTPATASYAQFSGTISGGVLTSLTLISGGKYNVNPLLTGEALVGCGLTGATANIVMGVATFGPPAVAGSYTSQPATLTQSATTGVGTGATATPTFYPLGQSFVVGTDDTADLVADAAKGGRINIPRGIYLTAAPMLVPSNSDVYCPVGGVTFIAETNFAVGDGIATPPGPWILGNVDWNASAITDHDIYVHGCGFTHAWFGNAGGTHAIHMVMAQHVYADHIRCDVDGDCTAFAASRDTHATDSVALHISNACFDHWGGAQYYYVTHNYCETSLYGILGNSTFNFDNATTAGGDASENVIKAIAGSNFQVGVWLGSINGDEKGSGAIAPVARNNTVDANGTPGYCVENVGASIAAEIGGNICKNAVKSPTAIADVSDTAGTPQSTHIVGNKFVNWNITNDHSTTPALISAIGNRDLVESNIADGTAVARPIFFSGTGDRFLNNWLYAGSGGYAFPSGATNYSIRDLNMPTPGVATAGVGPTYAPGANDNGGTLNVGSGAVTSITIPWSMTRGYKPSCTVSSDVAGANPVPTPSTTNLVIATSVSVGGGHIFYQCPDP